VLLKGKSESNVNCAGGDAGGTNCKGESERYTVLRLAEQISQTD